MQLTTTITNALLAVTANSVCPLLPAGSCNALTLAKTEPDIGVQLRQAIATSSEHNQNVKLLGNEVLENYKATVAALSQETLKNAALEMQIDSLENDNECLRRESEANTIIIAHHQAEKCNSDRKTKELTLQHSYIVGNLSTSLDQCAFNYQNAEYIVGIQREMIETYTDDLSACNADKAELKGDIKAVARLQQAIGLAKHGLTGILSNYLL